jgi:thiamine-monophosphate kinase
MKTKRNPSFNEIGELAVIERIRRYLPRGGRIVAGVGDDCAVVRMEQGLKNDLLLTSDAVIEGIHFLPGTKPSDIGHKAIARVLSDIAAMGGRPEWALIDLVVPGKTKIRTLDGIYSGAIRVAGEHGLSIVGGDTASGPALELHVFAVGTVPQGKAVLRSGARPGDFIFVTGTLGGSCRGKHFCFKPRVAEGLFLRKWASSMIDISDGLASDLKHLATMSRTGARLVLDSIPVSSAASRIRGKLSPVQHALYDGEDFELLFTIPSRKLRSFIVAWARQFNESCSPIGLMTNEKNLIECAEGDGNTWRLERKGYEHFKR